jgi:membrane-associated phospholipid phosphatase
VGPRFETLRPGHMSPIATVETHHVKENRRNGAPRAAHGGVLDFPVLEAPERGPAERLADSLARLHPALVFVVLMLAGLAIITLISIGLGFFVVRVVERGSIGAADERVNGWLAAHRTGSRTEASLIGSIIAGGVVLPIVAGVSALIAAVFRRWRLAAFAVFSLAVESATYRGTTLVVHSHRPTVPRLEHLPVNASYPSGHTAAAIAVYGGLALLFTSRYRNGAFRTLAWTLVVAVVTFVATARMYRGMHHPLDVAGGIVIGIAALIVVVFACRTAGAAAERR